LENKLKDKGNICLQGELIGEGIQGNPYKIKGQTVHFFNGFDIDTQTRMNINDFLILLDELELLSVPILDVAFLLPDNFCMVVITDVVAGPYIPLGPPLDLISFPAEGIPFDIGIDDEMFDPLDSFAEGKKKEKEPKADKDGMSAFGKGSLTTGDKIGMISGAAGTLLNAGLTIANRLGDKKNTNSFLTYAQDSIRTMNDSKRYAQNMFDYALQDIDFNEAGARRGITQNARGINQQRGLQLGLHAQGQDARRKARVDYAGSMLGINKDISRLQERHDQMSMSADERRLDKDKADRDAFFSNLSSNVTDATLLGQHVGKNLNDSLETQQKLKILEQYGKYSMFDEDFNLVGKPVGTTPASSPATTAKAAPASNAYTPNLFSTGFGAQDNDYEFEFENSINSPFSPAAPTVSKWNPVTKKLYR
jgi:hypothetical protein